MLNKQLKTILLTSFVFLPLQAWTLVDALDQNITQDEALTALTWIQKKKSPGVFKTALGKVTDKYFKGDAKAAMDALQTLATPAAAAAPTALPEAARKALDSGNKKEALKQVLVASGQAAFDAAEAHDAYKACYAAL